MVGIAWIFFGAFNLIVWVYIFTNKFRMQDGWMEATVELFNHKFNLWRNT